MTDRRMGQLFDPSRYVPLPPRDPRWLMSTLLGNYDRERKQERHLESQPLAREAGIGDIDPRRPYPRPGSIEFQGPTLPVTEEENYNQIFPAMRGAAGMIDTRQFYDMLSRRPESQAPVIYEPSYYTDWRPD
jgi:hypothetical protein